MRIVKQAFEPRIVSLHDECFGIAYSKAVAKNLQDVHVGERVHAKYRNVRVRDEVERAAVAFT